MTTNNSGKDFWAVVFGATDKSIEKFSESLAANNVNLVLVDRNKALLHKMANDLYKKYEIRVEAILVDKDNSITEPVMMERLRELDISLVVPHESVDNMGESIRNILEEKDISMDTHKVNKLNVYSTRYFAEAANNFIEML